MKKYKSDIRTEIYYKKSQAYNNENKKLETWTGSQRNKELIKKFQTSLFSKGTKQLRVAKLTWEIRKICDWLKKDLDKTNKEDIELLIANINQNENYAELTKSDYRRAIKSFYLWFEDEDQRLTNKNDNVRNDANKMYKWLKKNVKSTIKGAKHNPSSIITEEEVKKILDEGCENALEKALISTLHETGVRVGELLGMRIKHLKTKEKYAVIDVDGKTGERPVYIIRSMAYIYKWLEEHPDKKNPEALIWVSKANKYYGSPLKYYGVVRMLQRACKKAKITKKHNAHWFRHSRATILAQNKQYSDNILYKMMGWQIGSKQGQTYIHLSGHDSEIAFAECNGVIERERPEQKINFCDCGASNPSESRYCFKCGKPSSVSVLLEDVEKRNDAVSEAFDLFVKIMSNPELKKKFEDFKKSQFKHL